MQLRQFVGYLSKVELQINGANFTNLLNEISKNQIPLLKVIRAKETLLCIQVRKNYMPSLIAILQNKCYNYTITQKLGFQKISAGALIGFFVCLIALCVLSNFCFGVKINSDQQELKNRVNEVLYQHGYGNICTWKSLNFSKIEDLLRNEIENLSLVNVTKKGAYLWINFSNATLPDDIEQVNTTGIVATVNGVVSRIFVSSGTALVKVGDTVSLGQMLIAPYYLDEEENQIQCISKGAVFVYVWNSATVEFSENSIEMCRTGASTTGHKVVFGDNVLGVYEPEITYNQYDTETKKQYISNVLPVYMEYTTYFELTPIPIKKEFKAEEQALIYEAKQKVLKSINENDILEEKHTIALVGDKYYITYYVKLEVQI